MKRNLELLIASADVSLEKVKVQLSKERLVFDKQSHQDVEKALETLQFFTRIIE